MLLFARKVVNFTVTCRLLAGRIMALLLYTVALFIAGHDILIVPEVPDVDISAAPILQFAGVLLRPLTVAAQDVTLLLLGNPVAVTQISNCEHRRVNVMPARLYCPSALGVTLTAALFHVMKSWPLATEIVVAEVPLKAARAALVPYE